MGSASSLEVWLVIWQGLLFSLPVNCRFLGDGLTTRPPPALLVAVAPGLTTCTGKPASSVSLRLRMLLSSIEAATRISFEGLMMESWGVVWCCVVGKCYYVQVFGGEMVEFKGDNRVTITTRYFRGVVKKNPGVIDAKGRLENE